MSPTTEMFGRKAVGMAKSVAGTIAMATHRRLGKECPLHRFDKEILARIVAAVDLVVPDAIETLGDAVQQAMPGQRVLIKKGEYTVGARDAKSGIVGNRAADNILSISKKGIRIHGEEGAVLRGMLLLEEGSSGHIEGFWMVDAGQSCLKVYGGDWQVENCYLQCGHASSLFACHDSKITLTNCRLGGEEPTRNVVTYHEAYGSIQEFGNISKRACYGLLIKDSSRVNAYDCLLSYCSEAAVFLSDTASVALQGCNVEECSHAFVSGYGFGDMLQVERGQLRQIKAVWFDSDRPRVCDVKLDGLAIAPPSDPGDGMHDFHM